MKSDMTTTPHRRPHVVVPVPDVGFDPTEAAVPWLTLTSHGADVTFATKSGGATVAKADPIVVTGVGFYALKWALRADQNGRDAYEKLEQSGALARTISFSEMSVESFDGVLIPGGHCPDMRPFLEDQELQEKIAAFHAAERPIASVCHGVLIPARIGAFKGRTVTGLPWWMEQLSHNLTRMWMGDYYRTYPGTSVQEEVTAAGAKEFLTGPKSLAKDNDASWKTVGFCVRDGHLLTARWPGDTHRLGHELLAMVSAVAQSRERPVEQ